MTGPADARRAELAANLAAVHTRLDRACASAGRDPAEVTLIAVTKTWPASDVRVVAELGLTDVAENRDQEARTKVAELADLPLRWHFVGQLQTNKCRSVVGYADVVHSVDRLRLAHALGAEATRASRTVTALVQVRLDDMVGRGGAAPDEVAVLADAVAGTPGLALGGVMAVAPLGGDPERAFARLARVSAAVRDAHPEATIISAGMSSDLEHAVRHGSTHVRVGTALLGGRTPPVR